MNSKERHEGRYQRRKARRLEKRAQALGDLDDYDKVFTYKNLYESYCKSRRNVAWKASVQGYVTQAPVNVWRTYYTLSRRAFKPSRFTEFDIFERGKTRHICSVGIGERVVQRCLCDHCLVPALSRSFIFDNGASLAGKGYSFSRDRLMRHLRQHYRKHGADGYILLFDLSRFFESVPHDRAKECIANVITDESLLALCYALIDTYDGERGLGLGSQISQIVSLAVLSPLDHHIKDHLGIRHYGRYMDDGYVIHQSKGYLRQVLVSIRRVCEGIGVRLNERKTQIVKLSRGFSWLKTSYRLLPTGRIVRKPDRRTHRRMRRRLKAFRARVDAGLMDMGSVAQSFQSWRSHLLKMYAHRSVRSMERLYSTLFEQQGG